MTAMLDRVLEPEVMDTADEAADYDAMDHSAVNGAFCTDFFEASRNATIHRVLDVGTGTALIPVALCTKSESLRVVAIDLAEHMLTRARHNVRLASLTDRITLEARDAKACGWHAGEFDAVVSNSIIHHIPEPVDALREMWRLVGRGGVLFVRDLSRPSSEAELLALVTKHAPTTSDDPREGRQRMLFEASLRAALRPDEMAEVARRANIAGAAVTMTSDRHWTLIATRSRE